MPDLATFDAHESEVRSYIRSWPTVFSRAKGHLMWDEGGREYLDLFAGAGALNYGHNDPDMQQALVDYIRSDGPVHSLDMATVAKRTFIERFRDVILEPRGLNFVLQFPGPTGTNAVEAALKLARKVTGRELVIGFTNGFHGMTLGSLAVTGNDMKRGGGGVPLNHATSLPYDGFLGDDGNAIDVIDRLVRSSGSGLDLPAAFIVETVQGEGGVNVASDSFMQRLRALCDRHDILLIVDDIQMGCGRTGPFFSFEHSGIRPDIVTLSKSISGSGLPLALTLFGPELDQWQPGEHNGTFRGNNPAFVTATVALDWWQTDELERSVGEKGEHMAARLTEFTRRYPQARGVQRGRGMIQGIDFQPDGLASAVARAAFDRGVLLETSGATDRVAKLMPALTIPMSALEDGLDRFELALQDALRATGMASDPEFTAVGAAG